jgi:hypothetical protein
MLDMNAALTRELVIVEHSEGRGSKRIKISQSCKSLFSQSRERDAPAARLLVAVDQQSTIVEAAPRTSFVNDALCGFRPSCTARLSARYSSAMPEESTTPDQVQSLHQAFAAGSAEDLDGVTADLAPNAVWVMDEVGLGPFEGVDVIREFLLEWWSLWKEHNHHVEEAVVLIVLC